ncbi:nucleoside hydrolase [Paenibacillus filicis]|uniref:Nucleoside hydrolase n=1 Tax=Paenibacillus filicis TaxID=669464 RepID=A0ABU9DK14_9BACL
MIEFPKLTGGKLLNRLAHPAGKVRAVLDTDTFNEIDDPFAVVYALKSPESLTVEAFYAAPFHNEHSDSPGDGMEKSYWELHKIRELLPEASGIPICRGAVSYLPGPAMPAPSEAARDLVDRAMASADDDPLYVLAIGAITNVASAIMLEPRIMEKIIVVWLGGHALHWPHTREFNMCQDLHASRLVLHCGVPLVLIPCMGVASHLQTTLSELNDHIRNKGFLGQYLYETFRGCASEHTAYSRVIWDMSAIAYLVNPAWLPSSIVHSPVLSEDFRWSFDTSRHWLRYVQYVQRNDIFKDFFAKL